jgi:hypothetical protein
MGENKTLNLKDNNFARYHAIDIHIKFCVWKQLKRNYMTSNRKRLGKIIPF